MVRLIQILEQIICELKKDNPYGLILKGGTAIAVHHVPGHRESEDLDFDVSIERKPDVEDILKHLEKILGTVQEQGAISGFELRKRAFSSAERYHISLIIRTHVEYQTKVDLDFIQEVPTLEKDGQLNFYTKERMFVSKLITYSSRREFKDLFDIWHLMKKIDPKSFDRPDRVAELVGEVLSGMDRDALAKSFTKSFRNIDLRFKGMKERDIPSFVDRTVRELGRFRNELMKRTR